MAITLSLCRLTAEWMEQIERESGGGWGEVIFFLIFLLHYVWVFTMCGSEWHPIFQSSSKPWLGFLTARLHWRSRWTNSANLLTWRSGGSVHPDCISLLKPPKLIFSLVLSRLVYYNALLAGCPRVFLKKLKEWSTAHITPLFYDLHLRPISSRIKYKISLIRFHVSLSCFISPLFLILFLASDISCS